MEYPSCKLPLLDGRADTKIQILTAKVELEDEETIREDPHTDNAALTALICTAWGLLLRCYTGRDDVAFQLRAGDLADRSQGPSAPHLKTQMFAITFDENDTLSTSIKTAKNSYASLRHNPPAKQSNNLGSQFASASQGCNSGIWIHEGSFSAVPSAMKFSPEGGVSQVRS